MPPDSSKEGQVAPRILAETDKSKIAHEQSFIATFIAQMYIMLRRNTILQYRWLAATLAQALVAPFVFTLLIYVLQAADTSNQLVSNIHPPLGALPGVSQCQGRDYGEPCITLFYYPASVVQGVDYSQIMRSFASKNAERTGYTLKIDPALSSVDESPTAVRDIIPVPNADFIYDYALKHPNTTAWGVTFNQAAAGLPVNIQYQLWFNATNSANGTDIFGRTVLSMIRGLDEAIISVLNDPAATVSAELDYNVKDWPVEPPARTSDAVVQALGPVFMFCSEMIIFINVLSTIVSEKELKLRHGMEVMGLKPGVYWFSQLVSNSLLVLINSLSATAWGYIFGFEAFRNTNAAVILCSPRSTLSISRFLAKQWSALPSSLVHWSEKHVSLCSLEYSCS